MDIASTGSRRKIWQVRQGFFTCRIISKMKSIYLKKLKSEFTSSKGGFSSFSVFRWKVDIFRIDKERSILQNGFTVYVERQWIPAKIDWRTLNSSWCHWNFTLQVLSDVWPTLYYVFRSHFDKMFLSLKPHRSYFDMTRIFHSFLKFALLNVYSIALWSVSNEMLRGNACEL